GIVDKDGVKFSFECEYPEGIASYTQQLPYMQQAWKEIGVEMIPVSIPFTTLVDHVTSSNYVMSVLGFSWGVDPDQGTMFRTDAKPPAGFNLTAYSNPKYDSLNDQQNVELDVKKRVDLLIEQTNLVNEDLGTGVTVFQKSIAASAPRVHNYVSNAYVFGGTWSYSYVWLDS
ncbi:MAG TPA: hypothetical protein VFQ54_05940, partial [Thermomicrobiales bacterium]|nr:hypothetical protein [Thermomicrobiales bacterium]